MRTGFHMCSTIIASITLPQPSFNQQHTPFTASILNVPVYNLMGLALTRRNETATPCVAKHSCAMLLSSRVRCVCLHIETKKRIWSSRSIARGSHYKVAAFRKYAGTKTDAHCIAFRCALHSTVARRRDRSQSQSRRFSHIASHIVIEDHMMCAVISDVSRETR